VAPPTKKGKREMEKKCTYSDEDCFESGKDVQKLHCSLLRQGEVPSGRNI